MFKILFVAVGFAISLAVISTCLAEPQTLKVPMRDGVKLATDIYLPDGDGPWGAILVQTPYGKDGLKDWAAQANERGYALVAQDFRGRFDSEGVDYPVFLHSGWSEHQDGYDTVEWIAAQKWCNGKVGGMGISAPAIALNMMAPTRPPHLVCEYVAVAFSSMYHQCAYQGGAFRRSLLAGWLAGNQFSPENLKIFQKHPNYDDFWKQFNCESVAERVDIPVLFLGGWYDIFSIGTINSFMTVQKRGDKGARGKCLLVMEAYGHGQCEDLVFPDKKRPRLANLANWLDWFDLWMKNDGKGLGDIPAVQYFVMGDPDDAHSPGNVWRSAPNWPIPAKEVDGYFLPDGTLSLEPPMEDNASMSYEYDPNNPVPTVGGANLLISKGPMDQRQVENRPDVLVFTSKELDKYVEVTGNIKVKLWASSTAPDTDFTAKLCDVYPDGRSMLVCDGVVRAAHRNSLAKTEPMESGKVYEFEIDLWDTSLVFSPGHRIRVSISSSNFPRFEANPNTGSPFLEGNEGKKATNTIYMDTKRPSHIVLPVVQSK